MANSGPDAHEFNTLGVHTRKMAEHERTQKELDPRLQKLNKEWEARLDLQQRIMGKYRSADPTQIGGLVGKFCHLADLNAEQLAGQVIGQILFDLLGLMCNREYRIDCSIYDEATAANIAYDGSQTIFKMDAAGNLDFNNAYKEGEQIPLADIYRNGYIPPASQMAALGKHMNQSISDYMGPTSIRDDGLVMMFGAKTAKELRQKNANRKGHDTGSDLAAQGAFAAKPALTKVKPQ